MDELYRLLTLLSIVCCQDIRWDSLHSIYFNVCWFSAWFCIRNSITRLPPIIETLENKRDQHKKKKIPVHKWINRYVIGLRQINSSIERQVYLEDWYIFSYLLQYPNIFSCSNLTIQYVGIYGRKKTEFYQINSHDGEQPIQTTNETISCNCNER